MENKKYYALKLKYCYNSKQYYISYQNPSFLSDVLTRAYKDLDSETLKNDFLSLETQIIQKEGYILALGEFPVIATEIYKDGNPTGIMEDLVTGELIYPDDTHSLGYTEATPIYSFHAKILLQTLTQEDIESYKQQIKSLKLRTKNMQMGKILTQGYIVTVYSKDTEQEVYAKEVDGTMLELLTNTPIYQYSEKAITPLTRYRNPKMIKLDEINLPTEEEKTAYLEKFNKIVQKNILEYNMFVENNLPDLKPLSTKKDKERLIRQILLSFFKK